MDLSRRDAFRPCSRDSSGHKVNFVLLAKQNKTFFNWNRPPLPEVESRTQGSRPRPRTQKKSEAKAKDSPSEDRTSRGQGPRTQAQVFSKKKVFKNFFQAISNLLAYPEFIGISLNHKSNEMTSSKFFQRGSFCGINISYDGRSDIAAR